MKKMLVAIAALAWAGAAFAGDFHIGRTLRCSQCHTMHASRAHGFSGDAAAIATEGLAAVTPGAANANLLIAAGTNATCLACHDTASTPSAFGPDVFGAQDKIFTPGAGGVAPATLHRSAGALNGAGSGFQDWMGHTMGSMDQPPGVVGFAFEANTTEGFNCAQCHFVHGNDAFRNLGVKDGTYFPTYNAKADYGEGARAAQALGTDDVTVTAAGRTYDTAEVRFGIGAGRMNAYCGECHGNFHGDPNTEVGDGNFKRHPTSNASATRVDTAELADNAATDIVRPAWGVGADPVAKTGSFQAACLSCHKAHGNARGYGLIYPAASGNTDYENGSAAADGSGIYPLRNLCSTCHYEGQELNNL